MGFYRLIMGIILGSKWAYFDKWEHIQARNFGQAD
jgi:hypothetical protein